MMGIPEELAPLIAIAVIEEYVILVTQTAAFVIKDSFILKPKKLAFSIANAVMQPSTVQLLENVLVSMIVEIMVIV